MTFHDVAFAALKQHAGQPSAWEQLLTRPAYATFALMALAPSFDQKLGYLGQWWEAVDDDEERSRELAYLIQSALRDSGEAHVRERLLARRTEVAAGIIHP